MPKLDLDVGAVRKLADLLKETGLTEIEYADGDRRIRCVSTPPAIINNMSSSFPSTTAMSVIPSSGATAAVSKEPTVTGTTITAPMVGTVYLSSEPGAGAFVSVGDKVKVGDTLLIIEAMKVMNPIKASVAGTIGAIIVTDGRPVEFGEALMVIE